MTIGTVSQSGFTLARHQGAGPRLLMARKWSPPLSSKPRLLDRVRERLRTHPYRRRTDEASVGWIRRDVLFHGRQNSHAGPSVAGPVPSPPRGSTWTA